MGNNQCAVITNVQLWKNNKVWRDIVSVRDLEKEEPISNS